MSEHEYSERDRAWRFCDERGLLLRDGETGEVLEVWYSMQGLEEAQRVARAMALMDELFG